MLRLFLVIIGFGLAQGNICYICNCVFVNISQVEPKSGDVPKITFKYKMDAIEPFSANATYDAVEKYFYIDCSSDNNVGNIDNLDWPKLKVLGMLGNFKNSKWKKLETFPEDVRNKMAVLSLSRNLITAIDEFELDSFSSLKMLNLSDNRIGHIRKGTFSKLALLRVLDLSGNWITEVDDWAFYGTALEYLDLSRNHISALQPDVFRGLNNLTVLDLSDNGLFKMPDDLESSLPSLVFLSLRKNMFQRLPALPKELRSFDASHNDFVDLHLSHLNLEVLDVSHNELLSFVHTNFPMLKVLRASHNYMTQLSHLKTNRVTILDLSHNKFSRIPEVVSSDKLPFLEELYLDGNPISNISFPPQSEPFPNLRVVGLSHLKSVKKIIKHSFQGVFPKVTHNCSKESGIVLNFSHNSIKFVDKDAFQTFSVCSIDFSHNQLKTLSENLLPWKEMSYINLQENPWQCDCNIQWMLDDFLDFMYKNHPSSLFELRCATPLRYSNKMFVFWYNRSDHVFCNAGPSSFYLDLMGGKKIEIWTVSAITCVVLGCIILIITIVIIVLACTRPKRRHRPVPAKKSKGPPYYKQIPNQVEDKNQRHCEKTFLDNSV